MVEGCVHSVRQVLYTMCIPSFVIDEESFDFMASLFILFNAAVLLLEMLLLLEHWVWPMFLFYYREVLPSLITQVHPYRYVETKFMHACTL